jgi:SnoaL-like domain/Aldehyde dehydrogenase family
MNVMAQESAIKTLTTHYIDGVFVESNGREVMDIVRPTDSQVIGRVTLADEEDTRRAIAAAKRAFATYGRSTKEERADLLRRLHQAASARIDDLTAEAYAHCADRRDAKGQMALFTADTHFVVYMNAKDPTPSQELHSREALAPVFADLNQYAATMHFVGQSTVFTLTGDRATGEAYCIAHHLTVDGENRRLMVAYLRYLDSFAKIDGAWLFSERLLYVDWLEQRALS